MRLTALTVLVSALALLGATEARSAGLIQLTGTVGPGFTITLKNHGKAVKSLSPGRYSFLIVDRSKIHNFHLTGPGVNKKTSVARTGKTRWILQLRPGTYRYVCDPHKTLMHGKFVVAAP